MSRRTKGNNPTPIKKQKVFKDDFVTLRVLDEKEASNINTFYKVGNINEEHYEARRIYELFLRTVHSNKFSSTDQRVDFIDEWVESLSIPETIEILKLKDLQPFVGSLLKDKMNKRGYEQRELDRENVSNNISRRRRKISKGVKK